MSMTAQHTRRYPGDLNITILIRSLLRWHLRISTTPALYSPYNVKEKWQTPPLYETVFHPLALYQYFVQYKQGFKSIIAVGIKMGFQAEF